MRLINRTALLFQPKQPLIDWLNENDESSYVYKIDERRNDAGLFLVEEVKSISEIRNLIDDNFTYFFELALDKYPFAKETWPDTSNFMVFEEWIDFTYHTIVEDMCDLPLSKESDYQLNKHNGIGLPIAEEPSHTTRTYGSRIRRFG